MSLIEIRSNYSLLLLVFKAPMFLQVCMFLLKEYSSVDLTVYLHIFQNNTKQEHLRKNKHTQLQAWIQHFIVTRLQKHNKLQYSIHFNHYIIRDWQFSTAFDSGEQTLTHQTHHQKVMGLILTSGCYLVGQKSQIKKGFCISNGSFKH